MDKDKAIIVFKIPARNFSVDLEVPLSITANDLVNAMNTAYKLGIDTSNVRNNFLKSENPVALLRGEKTLDHYGIRNGSIIYFTE